MKILIIRFSSIGDLTQALSIPSLIKFYHPEAVIDFVTRQDLSELLHHNPHIHKIWTLDRRLGLSGLWSLIQILKKENYTHIYDAHNNLRSSLIRWALNLRWQSPITRVRPMMRWKRFLLIRFQINLFEKPFSGQRDLLKPLEAWGLKYFLPAPPQLFLDLAQKQKASQILHQHKISEFVVLVPSAAYPLKRWPLAHWHELIKKNQDTHFVVLAGPTDSFTAELNQYSNVTNLTGQTSLLESAAIIEKAQVVVTNDTGLLHFAEQLGRPAIALMGPAPFGFPSRSSTTIFERNLKCRPCSKHGQGPCRNSYFQECLVSISPEEIHQELRQKKMSLQTKSQFL